ncbi:MAG: bifunctional chorismate mutase/prephenate dehydratase [Planctomycetota bacterium]
MTDTDDLQSLRDELEELDRQILSKLRDRMTLVEQVARAKLARAFPFRDHPREEQVLQRVRHAAVELGLDAHEIERLYRHIMAMSISRQQAYVQSLETAPLRVAFQGVEGAYSHLTAQHRYAQRKGGVLLSGYATFRMAVQAVKDGSADFALLPIENTTAGSINETYDLLSEGGITITAEMISLIDHCLLALPGTRIEELRVVLSHPQALHQCEEFLRKIPWARPQDEFDTAGAARKVLELNRKDHGAIAGQSAARLFGLEVLARGIQSQEGNYTRFVEVAREATPCPHDSPCKTSLLLQLAHQPGALGEVLSQFGRRGVNLTKLESRPIPGEPWKYRFYLDLQGHAASVPITDALEAVRPMVSELRILGTYPQAEELPTNRGGSGR